MRRRTFLSAPALAGVATASVAKAADRRSEAEAALRAFLRAFENGELAVMEAAFPPDSVSFDPVVMSEKGSGPVDHQAYRRRAGMPMRALVEGDLKSGKPPPYRKLDPKDLLVQIEGDVAVCTFHLDGPTSLARRTIVLVRRDGGWKILHLHGSNVSWA